MPEPVLTALIVAVVGPGVLFGLSRLFGGHRRDRLDNEAKLAAMWEAWSKKQDQRITDLEADVAELKEQLAAERDSNQGLQEQNRRQATLLTDLIRWAILLRDEVIRLGGSVPPAPVAVESALTTLDPPQ